MRRVLSLYLPNLASDRLRKTGNFRLDHPLVTVSHQGNRRIIAHADKVARKIGLQAGQLLATAQAMVPELQMVDADPAADATCLLRLAHWCIRRYSPLVALDAPNGLWIDITGCDHRFGGEAGLQADLIEHCREVDLDAKIAIADTTGAAYAVARYIKHPTMIILPGKQKEAIAGLSLEALRLPASIVLSLHQLGFDYIHQLYEVPRAPFARRFGIQLMQRFDQALGIEQEPINPVELPETFIAKRIFSEPAASQEYLSLATHSLCVDLCKEIEEKALGVRIVDMRFDRVDGKRMTIRIGTSRLTRDPKHLARLLTEKIPEIDIGFGIETVALIAVLTENFTHAQHTSTFGVDQDIDLAALMDIFINRIGEDKNYLIQPVASLVPERSVKRVPPLSTSLKTSGWPPRLLRPSVLFAQAEKVDNVTSLLPDNPPVRFSWRNEIYRIKSANGPERVCGEWWERKGEVRAVRDYFLVEDDKGRRMWLYRRGDGEDIYSGDHQWFLHGFFA